MLAKRIILAKNQTGPLLKNQIKNPTLFVSTFPNIKTHEQGEKLTHY